MSDRSKIRQYLDQHAEGALVIDEDFADRAIVGIGERCGQQTVVVYDRQKLVEAFAEFYRQDADTDPDQAYELAEEWVSFNIEGDWMGPGTPMILSRIDPEELE